MDLIHSFIPFQSKRIHPAAFSLNSFGWPYGGGASGIEARLPKTSQHRDCLLLTLLQHIPQDLQGFQRLEAELRVLIPNLGSQQAADGLALFPFVIRRIVYRQ